ncbi:hypothetical protein ACFMPD_14350 [Sedimentitalea sp. HM32M-2]|uniref:hypothetical protein n=1 Tax=Sedimentitalea sp. HM32M-2 TaxID=3351566 RepID=UPI003631A94D
MATKAELEAELADLRAELERSRERLEETAADAAAAATSVVQEAPAALVDLLRAQGVGADEIAALWQRLSDELGGLPQNKPLLTAIGAFGLGFLLGRMSKS